MTGCHKLKIGNMPYGEEIDLSDDNDERWHYCTGCGETGCDCGGMLEADCMTCERCQYGELDD